MKNRMNAFRLILVTTALIVGSLNAKVDNGSQAPEFKLSDSNGKTHQLSAYSGKYVILEWTNHLCLFVRKHYDGNHMQKLQKEVREKDAIWLSIVSSAPGKQGHLNPEEANTIITEKGSQPNALLLDPEGEVGRLYGAQTTPHMFIISPEGAVIYQGAIDSIRSAKASDIPIAKNYVMAALNEALAGEPVMDANTKPYGCSVKY